VLIFVPMAILFDVKPGLVSLLALPGLLLIYLNQVWMALALGILATRFRDVTPIVSTAVQILFFATPVMWPVSLLGESTYIAEINPFHHFVDIVRAPMLGTAPAMLSWMVAAATVTAGFVVAAALLRRASRRLVFWL
jgi:ABC-type polysaccharide/polyol phosphate export permease